MNGLWACWDETTQNTDRLVLESQSRSPHPPLPPPLSPSGESDRPAMLQSEPCKDYRDKFCRQPRIWTPPRCGCERADTHVCFVFPHGDVSRSSLGRETRDGYLSSDHCTHRLLFFYPLKKNYKYHKRSIIYKLHAFQVRVITARKTQEREQHCFTVWVVQSGLWRQKTHADAEQVKPTWKKWTNTEGTGHEEHFSFPFNRNM